VCHTGIYIRVSYRNLYWCVVPEFILVCHTGICIGMSGVAENGVHWRQNYWYFRPSMCLTCWEQRRSFSCFLCSLHWAVFQANRTGCWESWCNFLFHVKRSFEPVEICAIVEHYAAQRGTYRRFGITYRSHLQDSCNWVLKMKQVGCAETSVMNYHWTLRNR
jgi:hypothetical protein